MFIQNNIDCNLKTREKYLNYKEKNHYAVINSQSEFQDKIKKHEQNMLRHTFSQNILPLFKRNNISPFFGLNDTLYKKINELPEIKEYKSFIKSKNINANKFPYFASAEEIEKNFGIDANKIRTLNKSIELKYGKDAPVPIIQEISTIYILKLLETDNIKTIDELEEKYKEYIQKISDTAGFNKKFNIDKNTAAEIVTLTFDEYGIPDVEKLNFIIENILPNLQKLGIKFDNCTRMDVEKLLNIEYPDLYELNFSKIKNSSTENQNTKSNKQDFFIKVIQFCRKAVTHESKTKDGSLDVSNYKSLLAEIDSQYKLDIYSDLYNDNFNTNEISAILSYAYNSENKTYDMDVIQKIWQLKPELDKHDLKLDFKDEIFVKQEINKLLNSKDIDLDIDIIKFCRQVFEKEYLNNEKWDVRVFINYHATLNTINSRGKLQNYKELNNIGYSIYDICFILDENSEFKNEDIQKAKKFIKLILPYIKDIDLDKGRLYNHFNVLDLNEIDNDKKQIGVDIIKKINSLKNTMEYFLSNKDKLIQHNEEIDENQIKRLINSHLSGIIELVDIIGQTGINSAVDLKYERLRTFLNNAESLSDLDKEQKDILKNKLQQFPHPEQKLEKISVISTLIGKTDNKSLLNIIKNIKSPKVTRKQIELANEIFADKTKTYNEQIEEFIVKFNVPEEKQDIIRKFLIKNNIQNQYRPQPSFEKQLQILNAKINAIVRNKNIPEDLKQIQLKKLNEKKQELTENPERYTGMRINDKMMNNLSAQIEAHINLPKNNVIFNKLINHEMYKLYGIEADENILNSNINYDDKYFFTLISNSNDNYFKEEFVKLIELIKLNPGKKFTEIIKNLPENQETEKLFKINGLNYEKWTSFDENSHHDFSVNVDVKNSIQNVKENLIQEFYSELAEKLDRNEIIQLIKITENMDIENASQKELPKIIKEIENYISKTEYWQDNNNPDIKTFKDHLKIHKKNIQSIEQLKNTKEELSVRLWNKNDIGRNLFYGNHVGCCTSIGSFNSFAAPQHLMNTFVNGMEIVDKNGNSMGNSMCYFAKTDGALTFVIDSFEANGKLGASKEVTQAITAYAKQICKDMGRADAKVIFGPNYNKINLNGYTKTENHTIEIIGKAPKETYIDTTGGYCNINIPAKNRAILENLSDEI